MTTGAFYTRTFSASLFPKITFTGLYIWTLDFILRAFSPSDSDNKRYVIITQQNPHKRFSDFLRNFLFLSWFTHQFSCLSASISRLCASMKNSGGKSFRYSNFRVDFDTPQNIITIMRNKRIRRIHTFPQL